MTEANEKIVVMEMTAAMVTFFPETGIIVIELSLWWNNTPKINNNIQSSKKMVP